MVNKRVDFLLKCMNDKILPEAAEQKQREAAAMQNQSMVQTKEQNVNTRPAENIRQQHLDREMSERQQLERQYYEQIVRNRSYQRERLRT